MTDKTDSKEREALIRAITSMCHDMDNDSITITRRKGEGPALRQLLDAMQCELASLAANAGSEPVARVNDDGFIVEIGDLLLSPGQKLYLHPSPPEGMVGGWRDIATAPIGRDMFIVRAFDVQVTEKIFGYTSDAYGVWQPTRGRFERWPHPFEPTHWMPLPPPPTSSADSRKGE